MWLRGTIAGKRVALAVVYWWTGSSREHNAEMSACLRKDIQSLREEHEILLVGDFNAHIEDLGDRPDASGNLLLGLAEYEGLVIGNLTGKCTGRVTWAVRDLQSCIDYGLMSEGLYAVLDSMIIPEDRKGNLGSDHNRVVLTFQGHNSHSRRQGHRQTGSEESSQCKAELRFPPTERELERPGSQEGGLGNGTWL